MPASPPLSLQPRHVSSIQTLTDEPRMAVVRTRGGSINRVVKSAIKSHVDMKDTKDHTTERLLLGTAGRPVSIPGDSGCWVVTRAPSLTLGVAGMVLGGPGDNSEWCYMTPMDVLLADIEKKLKCRAQLLPVAEEEF